MKAKIYKIFFCILIISIIFVIGLILIKNMQSYENEKKNQEIVEVFSNSIVDDTQEQNTELVIKNNEIKRLKLKNEIKDKKIKDLEIEIKELKKIIKKIKRKKE